MSWHGNTYNFCSISHWCCRKITWVIEWHYQPLHSTCIRTWFNLSCCHSCSKKSLLFQQDNVSKQCLCYSICSSRYLTTSLIVIIASSISHWTQWGMICSVIPLTTLLSLHYDNRCKRQEIMYYRIIFSVILSNGEYRLALMPKKHIYIMH